MNTTQLIDQYYEAFNRQDRKKMLSLLSPEIVHDINQGAREVGLDAFERFLVKMDSAYLEKLKDIVIMVDVTGRRAAAEFVVHGTYLKTDNGLPVANGQKYVLPAGAFFEVDTKNLKITRISTHYNLPAWIEMVK